jgi:hypothetical protein
LSGGWRRRARWHAVAEPDQPGFDELTNHLDIDAITWLEDFLAAYEGAVALRPTIARFFTPCDAHRRDRSRSSDLVARRLRDIRWEKGGVAR